MSIFEKLFGKDVPVNEKEKTLPQFPDDEADAIEIPAEEFASYVRDFMRKRNSRMLQVTPDNVTSILEWANLDEREIHALMSFAKTSQLPKGGNIDLKDLKFLDLIKDKLEAAIEKVNKK